MPAAFARAATTHRYIEPFLGGAAAFFHIEPKLALLSDLNADLISTYKAVRNDTPKVVARLQEHAVAHSLSHYYSTRATKPTDASELAAWFLYLNRTCFNGIYRVNKRGEFNVPIGTKASVFLETDDFSAASQILSRAELRAGDFEAVINEAGEGDFIFADPPYTVKHNLNGFIKYNEQIFSWKDQERLASSLRRASDRGALVLVSNANHESIRELYKGFTLSVAHRTTVIGADESSRGRTSELLIGMGSWNPEDLTTPAPAARPAAPASAP